MNTSLVLTVLGPDRPGLVRSLAEQIAAAGGNWLEGRMATLAGQFAGVVLVELPAERASSLVTSLRALESQGLRVTVDSGASGPSLSAGRVVQLELVGQDRPGIVRDVSRVLADRGVSVEQLDTGTASAPFSGESLFQARARLRLPAPLSVESLRAALQALANELMADIKVDETLG